MIMTFTHLLRSVCGNTTRHFLSFIHLVLVPTKLEISIGLVHFLVGSFKMFTLKQFLFLSNLFINLWIGNWVIIKIMDSILWGLALDKNKTLSRLKSMSASRWFEEQGLSRAFFFGDNQIHIFLKKLYRQLQATLFPRSRFESDMKDRIRSDHFLAGSDEMFTLSLFLILFHLSSSLSTISGSSHFFFHASVFHLIGISSRLSLDPRNCSALSGPLEHFLLLCWLSFRSTVLLGLLLPLLQQLGGGSYLALVIAVRQDSNSFK